MGGVDDTFLSYKWYCLWQRLTAVICNKGSAEWSNDDKKMPTQPDKGIVLKTSASGGQSILPTPVDKTKFMNQIILQ